MPKIQELPEDIFLKNTNYYEELPFGDETLAFNFRLPKSWERDDEKGSSNFQVSDKLMTRLAVFYGPASIYGRPRFQVSAISLHYDMDAEQWFLQDLMLSGMTSEGFIAHDKRRAEALMIVRENDISYVVRKVAQINGEHVLIAEHYMPVDLWDKAAGSQEKVIQSFQIAKPVISKIIKTQPYRFLDIVNLEYPVDWVDSPDPMTSVENMKTRFLNQRKQTADEIKKGETPLVLGRVDFQLIANWSTDSLLGEIERLKRRAESEGIILGERIQAITDYQYEPNVSLGYTEAYKVVSDKSTGKSYEFWFTLLISGQYYYFITLVTPSQDYDYVNWVKNIQSYKVIIESTKPSTKLKKI